MTFVKVHLKVNDRYSSKFLPYSFFEKEAYMAYPNCEHFIRSAKTLSLTFQAAYEKGGFNPKYAGLHNIVNHFTLEEIFIHLNTLMISK